MAIVLGRLDWDITRDEEGHRDYNLITLVDSESLNAGPNQVSTATGLPLPGAPWSFGGDSDAWAFCYPNLNARQVVDSEPNRYWVVSQFFSTRPLNRCQDFQVDDPVNEPPVISGTFFSEEKPLREDKDGEQILSSSKEVITTLQRRESYPTIRISFNSYGINLPLISAFIDKTVSDGPLFGLPPGTVRLSGHTWDRLYHGGCNVYYGQTFDFEIKESGWQIDDVIDTGWKVLRGRWVRTAGPPPSVVWQVDPNANINNPNDFVIFTDPFDNTATSKILLNGAGLPLQLGQDPVKLPAIDYLTPANYLLMGIPAAF